ncbi:MAG: hypothetical protein WCJ35_02390 [Planctomycetota bacterium]
MRRNTRLSVESSRPAPESVFDDEQQLGDLVKRVYTLERRMQASGLTELPCDYTAAPSLDGHAKNLEVAPRQSAWLKIARFLAEEKIGPIDYIARQFDQCRSLAKPLYHNELLGVAAWQRYTESKSTKQEDLRLQLRSSRASLASTGGVSAYVVWPTTREGRDLIVESYLSVLYCDNMLPPLFTYCAAIGLAHRYPAYGEDALQLAHRLEVQAAVEYIRFRVDYDAVWHDLIPRGFRGQAEGIYRRLLSELF